MAEFELLVIEDGILDRLLKMIPSHGAEKPQEIVYCRILSLCSKLLRIEGTNWTRLFSRMHECVIDCLDNGEESKYVLLIERVSITLFLLGGCFHYWLHFD